MMSGYIESAPIITVTRNSLADLKALNTASFSRFVIITRYRTTEGDNGGGMWAWAAGDQSANITADPQSGVWAESDSTASTSGAWERLYNGTTYAAWFGANSSNADNYTALQAALDWANHLAGGSVCVQASQQSYDISAPLTVYESTEFFGSSHRPTRLSFYNDTDGIKVAGTGATYRGIVIHDLNIVGNANLAQVNTVTTGLTVKQTELGIFYNLLITDFVDNLAVLGGSSGRFTNVDISSGKYPNVLNGYPRYGINLDENPDNGNRPQSMDFFGCRVYANDANQEDDSQTGDGVTTDFDFSWTGKLPLFGETGIKAYLLNATTGRWDLSAITTDYTLWGVDSLLVETSIPAGTTNVSTAAGLPTAGFLNYECRHVKIKFVVAPALGQAIKFKWCEPTGLIGFRLQEGSADTLRGGQVGGWATSAYLNSDSNIFAPDYIQICNTNVQVTSIGSNNYIPTPEFNDTVNGNLYTLDSAARQLTISPGAGREPVRALLTTDQTSSAAGTLTWNSVVGGTLPSSTTLKVELQTILNRRVTLNLDMGITAGGTATVDLKVSIDAGGSYTSLRKRVIACGSDLRCSIAIDAIDTNVIQRVGGVLPSVLYQVNITTVTGTWTVYDGILSVTEVNPP